MTRLERFAEAGADCLYAPGVTTREDIATIVKAVAPKPVNVLVSAPTGLTVADLAALGVRRISVGGALARMAWAGVMRAGKDLAAGRFDALADAASGADLNTFFTADARAARGVISATRPMEFKGDPGFPGGRRKFDPLPASPFQGRRSRLHRLSKTGISRELASVPQTLLPLKGEVGEGVGPRGCRRRDEETRHCTSSGATQDEESWPTAARP